MLKGALITISLVVLCTACQQKQPAGKAAQVAEVNKATEWNAFVDTFIEGFFKAHPTFAVVNGRHEYDGQLPDWSHTGIAAEIARLHEQRDSALAFTDATLAAQQRYQRDYLIALIDRNLFWLETANWPYRNPAFYFDWLLDSLDPSAYISLNYAPAEKRLDSLTRFLSNIPAATEQIQANLQHPLPSTYINYGVASFGGMAEYFANDLPQAFVDVGDEDAQNAFSAAIVDAAAAMQTLAGYLKSGEDRATDAYALGEELFLQMIRDSEGVDISLDELQAIGQADMRRNQQSLRSACTKFAAGKSIKQCIAKMAANKPEGATVAGATAQLAGLKAFLVEQDLVSIPGKEEALVRESPPYARSNFAYINIPGPYEKNQPSIYYISPPDKSWSAAEQAAYVPGKSDLLFTSAHEVWPGHFLNFLHAKRSDWIFGRIFVGYAYAEGWAHYTEEMMHEAGLNGGDPETEIGQLSNALLRNARFLSAIGLHAGEMSVEESERLFREEAFQDVGTARQQAARGTYDPAYLNYTLGKLMILRLREDWTRERGGRDAWKEFHDKFLSYGGPEIPLVRAQMLGGQPEAVFPER
ncbi:MAG: DUF885 domain-containing protein [Pseudomonadales bacterium]